MATQKMLWVSDNGELYADELAAVKADAVYWQKRCEEAEEKLIQWEAGVLHVRNPTPRQSSSHGMRR